MHFYNFTNFNNFINFKTKNIKYNFMGPCISKKKKEDDRPIEKGFTIYDQQRMNKNRVIVEDKKDFTY